jgi:argininosuccinate lyase
MMPQKKNPHSMEYLKAAAARVTGAFTTVLACSKNTAFADVNDGVSAVNVPALEAADGAILSLAVLQGVLKTLTVKPDVMHHAAVVGFGSSTELADCVVRNAGLSFRMAHNVVGRVVREAIAAGRSSADITAADLDSAALALFGKPLQIPEAEVRRALDPDENIRSRSVTGGPAPALMTEMLDRRRDALARDSAAIASVEARIADARERLMAGVAALIARHGESRDRRSA